MKLQYLGTAAAEGIPALFCRCETCRKARELGGRNVRTRSQALVDGKILIDWPSDAYFHGLANGIDFSDIHTLLITHVHEDHLYPADLDVRKRGYAHMNPEDTLTVYGSQDLVEKLGRYAETPDTAPGYRFGLRILEAGETVTVEDGYECTPLAASHGTPHPFCWLISHAGRTLLYAHDTSSFAEETWETLRRTGRHVDFASLDCTEGTRHIDYVGHMTVERAAEFREKLKSLGAADETTRFCLNHFSHNGTQALYGEMCAAAQPLGFEVSYDGKTVEF